MKKNCEEKNYEEYSEPQTEVYTIRWFILIATCLMTAITMFGSKSFSVANKIYAAYFNVSLTVLDWSSLALNAGAILVTPLFSWLFYKKSVGFKMLSVIGVASLLISYVVIVLSVVHPRLFLLMTVSNFLQGVTYTIAFTVGTSFAVMWFPDHQVSLAIASNAVSFSLGTLSGAIVPPALLVDVNNLTTTTNFTSQEIITLQHAAREDLLLMYAPILGTLVFILLFFVFFVTDLPPTPPTLALLKKIMDESSSHKSLSKFLKALKQLFLDFNFALCCAAVSIVYNIVTVEIVHITDIVAELNKRMHIDLPNNVTGGAIVTGYAVTCCFSAFASAQVLSKYKRFIGQTRLGSAFSFLSAVGMTLCLYKEFFVGFCLCIFVYGISTRVFVIPLLEIITRHTYPLDETFVSVWVSFFGCVAQVVFVEIARVLSYFANPIALLIFMSICLFISFVFIMLIDPIDKRGEISNKSTNPKEVTKILSESIKKYTE